MEEVGGAGLGRWDGCSLPIPPVQWNCSPRSAVVSKLLSPTRSVLASAFFAGFLLWVSKQQLFWEHTVI